MVVAAFPRRAASTGKPKEYRGPERSAAGGERGRVIIPPSQI
jgi:hypothetical protein